MASKYHYDVFNFWLTLRKSAAHGLHGVAASGDEVHWEASVHLSYTPSPLLPNSTLVALVKPDILSTLSPWLPPVLQTTAISQ